MNEIYFLWTARRSGTLPCKIRKMSFC